VETIKSCKATHGKYNIDNGNIVIQVGVELDTKTITKNIAIEVENLLLSAPKLKQQRDELLKIIKAIKVYLPGAVITDHYCDKCLRDTVNRIINEIEGAE
jgi:hypothetical protein